MIKIASPGGFDFGDPTIQLIKRSSRGLIGSDAVEFEKRASADMLRCMSDVFEKVASDEPLIHMLAVGATESYGPNRNGDGFPRAACERYYPTFEKFAYLYRNHKNKDPLKSYGRVVKSAFNRAMDRIELIVALNGTKQAAARNKGLFADREMEKLASGKDIPVSMACKIPFDVCSWCGHKAPSPKDYCTKSACDAGGLKDKIGALVEVKEAVHHLHAINDNPLFFDISHVIRPADRIAYVTGQIEKRAGFEVIKSAELAEELGVHVPYMVAIESTQSPDVKRMIKAAYQLADVEALIDRGECPEACLAPAFGEIQEVEIPDPQLTGTKVASYFRALADAKMVLPLAKFIEVTTKTSAEKSAELAALTSNLLPGIYTRMISAADFADKVSDARYAPSEARAIPDHGLWAAKHAADFSLERRHIDRRVTLASLRGNETAGLREPLATEKIASASSDSVVKMAEEYAMYKLAFISAIPDSDNERQLTATLAVVQDYAS